MTTKTDKIVIKGSPSKFDAAELLRRQKQYHHAFKETTQSCITVRGAHTNQFLQEVIEHAILGYTLTDYPASLEPTSYSVLMRKPVELQVDDLAKIDFEVKANYIKELEAEHASYKELLTKQLLQKEEVKRQKAENDVQAKLLAKVKAEVDACYTLVIPD